MQIDTWPWFHTCWGHIVLICPQVCKWVKFYIFRLSYKSTSYDLWPLFVTFNLMSMWRFLHFINKPNLVAIGLQLFKWGKFYILELDLWWLTLALVYDFDCMNIQKIPYFINKPSLILIRFQLFKWGYFHIFSLSYNLTWDDHWPWYVTFDLINKWGFPCCIYDPTLVEIHQSIWKIEPNVNLFSQQQQQTTTGDKVIPVVFPAKAGDTKTRNRRAKSWNFPLKSSTVRAERPVRLT